MMPPREEPPMERRGSRLSRRAFVAGAGVSGAALLAGCGRLPWQGQAQEPTRVARVGYLLGAASLSSPRAEAFRQGLRERGWVEGQNLTVEYRTAEGRREQLSELAGELVGLNLDVIVT